MLPAIESIAIEQRRQTLRAIRLIGSGTRQQAVEQVLHHAG